MRSYDLSNVIHAACWRVRRCAKGLHFSIYFVGVYCDRQTTCSEVYIRALGLWMTSFIYSSVKILSTYAGYIIDVFARRCILCEAPLLNVIGCSGVPT
jgi:hypothetical protein